MHIKNKDIEHEILEQALEWILLLDENNFSQEQLNEFEAWKNKSEKHQYIWHKIENTHKKLTMHSQQLPKHLTKNILSNKNNHKLMPYKFLYIVLIGGSAYIYMFNDYDFSADYQTRYGEQKTVILDDGTRILLNNKTAFNVNYDENRREIALKFGEIYIETAKDHKHRPFTVLNKEGVILALGTAFNVQQNNHFTTLSVIEHAVEVQPIQSQQKQILKAGYSVNFDASQISKMMNNRAENLFWHKGLVLVNRTSLDEFSKIIEKNYGIKVLISSDFSLEDLAKIEISGSFPIHDQARLIELLEQSYPIKIEKSFFTKKWVIQKN